jgi:hypothetical protein
VDVGTGDGQTEIEANGAADFVFGRRLWASVVARYGVQMKDEQLLRIPDVPQNPWQAEYREQMVSRDLGDYIELQATPRYVYNDYLSASLQWTYRKKAEDKYSGTFTVTDPNDEPVSLDASILGVGTEQTEQRIGGGATFSTLRAYDRGVARVPLEVQLLTVSAADILDLRFCADSGLRFRLDGALCRLHLFVRGAANLVELILVFLPDELGGLANRRLALSGRTLGKFSRLALEHPNKTVISLNPNVCVCSTMYRVDAPHLLWVMENLIEGKVVNQIVVPEPIASEAKLALQRMLDIA